MLHPAMVAIDRHEILRLRCVLGRYIRVVCGTVWLTQEKDRRDHILSHGENFQFDQGGLVLATPITNAAKVVLEGGRAPTYGGVPECIGEDRKDIAGIARLNVSDAMAWGCAEVAGGCNFGWGRIGRDMLAAMRVIGTKHELRTMSDRMLKDIGLRRDQIERLDSMPRNRLIDPSNPYVPRERDDRHA